MFQDALCIRYGWRPPDLPGTCVCGSSFTVTHALSCPYGGYPIPRHNDLFSLTDTLLREICTDVTIEPHLQPLTGEHLDYRTANREDNARLDVAADEFWGISGQRRFFDVRVFNPMTASLSNLTLHACYTRNEQEKKRLCDQRVWDVEFSSFSPLIFSTAGGLGPVATIVYKWIALSISRN